MYLPLRLRLVRTFETPVVNIRVVME